MGSQCIEYLCIFFPRYVIKNLKWIIKLQIYISGDAHVIMTLIVIFLVLEFQVDIVVEICLISPRK